MRLRTALVVVTLAEEMPANEARDLSATLNKQLGIKTAHVLINQVYPDRFPVDSPQSAVLDRLVDAQGALSPELAAITEHSDLARRRRRLNERYIEQLHRTVAAPQSLFPLLFEPQIGPDHIDLIAELIEQQVG